MNIIAEVNFNKSAIFSLIAIALSSCSDERQLIVETVPSGAMVYERSSGLAAYTPAVLTYTLPENLRAADGCFPLTPLEVHWASGATVSDSAPRFCGNEQWMLRYQRPEAPGLDVDVRAAATAGADPVVSPPPYSAATPALAAGANSLGQAIGAAVAGAPKSSTAQCDTARIPGYGDRYRVTCR